MMEYETDEPDEPDPIKVTMRRSIYDEVDRRVSRKHGAKLSDLAQSAPTLAYIAVHDELADVLLGCNDHSLRTLQPDAITDPDVEAYEEGRAALQDILTPSIEYDPRQVIISITRKRSLRQLIRHEQPEADPKLVFVADPH